MKSYRSRQYDIFIIKKKRFFSDTTKHIFVTQTYICKSSILQQHDMLPGIDNLHSSNVKEESLRPFWKTVIFNIQCDLL